MNESVGEERRVWETRPFVIAGNDKDWNSEIGDASEWLVCLVPDTPMRGRSIEDVAAVNHEVNAAGKGGG
jgi:hypothetical protein